MSEQFKELQQDVRIAKDFKSETFGDSFESIDSIEAYKEFILTPKFWAETLTISILEKELNMKVIVLSEFESKGLDRNEIIKCGEFTQEMQNEGYFKPDYYVLTSYTGCHYKSVSYKNRKILEFSENLIK